MISDVTRQRRAFWAHFAQALPELAARMERGNETSRWLPVGPFPLVAAHYVGAGGVGIFVRGPRGSRIGHVREILFPNREIIARHLRPELRLGNRILLHSRLRLAMDDRSSWPRSVAWFAETSPRYEAMLREVQGS